jgi:hypothetical protein
MKPEGASYVHTYESILLEFKSVITNTTQDRGNPTDYYAIVCSYDSILQVNYVISKAIQNSGNPTDYLFTDRPGHSLLHSSFSI